MKVFKKTYLILVFLLQACALGQVVEQIPSPESTTLAPQENVFVAAAFFTDPVGSIASVQMNDPHKIQKTLAITDSSDVVLRSFDGKLFVINRSSGTIQVFNPETMALLGNYSVGEKSNPQDLLVHQGKGYITRLDAHLNSENSDDLWIIEPEKGTLIKSINLKPFADDDGDPLARAAQMLLVEDQLFILLQDLSSKFKAVTYGKVVVLDTNTDTIVDTDPKTKGTQAISLVGRNPTSILHHKTLNKIFVTDTGFFDDAFNNDIKTSYGGIEALDPTQLKSEGFVFDDLDFGGYLSSLTLISETLAAVTVKAGNIALLNPKTSKITNPSLYTTTDGFIAELLVDRNGFLWIPENNPEKNGVVVVDPQTGAKLAGPLPVGATPASMTLIK